MEMGNRLGSVPRIPHPPDQLTTFYLRAFDDAFGDAPALAVGVVDVSPFAIRLVVVEVDVAGYPPAPMIDAEVTAVRRPGADPGHLTIADGENRDPLGG